VNLPIPVQLACHETKTRSSSFQDYKLGT